MSDDVLAPLRARQALDRFQQDFERLRSAVSQVVRGLDGVVERALLAALAGGHVLLEGNPGLGKTLLARSVAGALGLGFRRIQLTPDLLPADVVGTEVLRIDPATGARDFRFRPGPLHAHVVLADEVNRASPRTQSALLEAMAEGQVTVGRATHTLPRPFFLVATQNPVELEGTFPLPEAQIDRFAVRLELGYPEGELLEEVVRGGLRGVFDATRVAPALLAPGEQALHAAAVEARERADEDGTSRAEEALAAVTAPRIRALQATIRGAVETREAVRTVAHLLLALQPATGPAASPARRIVRLGPSPRAGQWLLLLAAARAARRGSPTVSSEDVEALAHDVLGHRVLLHYGEDPAAVPGLVAAALDGARARR